MTFCHDGVIYRDMKGRDLVRFMERLAMTRRDLAKRLDVNERTVLRWEREDRPIPRAVEIALRHIEIEDRVA